MRDFIQLLADIVNAIHDLLLIVTPMIGLDLTDKELHFWVIGLIGIVLFFAVDAVFRPLARRSITAVSLIYTFTVILVLVFAIEIQQAITDRGHMEFQDAVFGIWGFLSFFGAFLLLKGAVLLVRRLKK